jgi:hypothetical protein
VVRYYSTKNTMAILEQVHSFPKEGVASAFKFGANYGMLVMALTAADIRWEPVAPSKWQREFGLVIPGKKKLTDTQKKNLHKAAAQRLFPGLKITHAIADALLIAEWGRRVFVLGGKQAAEAAGGEL